MGDTAYTVMGRDFKQSVFGHCAVVFFLLMYVGVNEGVALFFEKTISESKPRSIGVEFVSQMKAEPLSQSEIETKGEDAPKRPVSRVSVGSSKSLKRSVLPIKNVQRQASEQSKITRTSMAKKVRLNQRVGQNMMGKTQAEGINMMSKGALNRVGDQLPTNAQVLGSKQVSSSALKQVKESIVKKSASVLSKVPTDENIKKKETGSLLAKEMVKDQQKVLKREQSIQQKKKQALEQRQEKERQLAAEAKRKQVVAEAKRKKMAAEAKRKKMAAEAERKKMAAEAKRKQVVAEAKRKKMAAEAERKQQEHQEYVQRTITKYGQMITAHIQNHAVFNVGMDKLKVNLKVELTLSGDVRTVLLAQTSGNASFDRLAINAVYKASPLPLPEDKDISEKMSTINLVIKPDDLR